MKKLYITFVLVLIGLSLPSDLGRVVHDQPTPQKLAILDKITATSHVEAAGLDKVPVSCPDYVQIVDNYDWDVNIAVAIMKAESGCNTDAVGDTWPIGGVLAPSCGLFQVRTISPSRGTCEQLKNPTFNVGKAYAVYKGQGWGAWSVFNNGQYRRYL